MKGILLKTNGQFEVQEFEAPIYKSIGKAIDGHLEIVRPRCLSHFKFVMVVDEEGILKQKPLNLKASILYGILDHGQPIVGDVVFMREEMTDEGMDFVDSVPYQLEFLQSLLNLT